MLQPNGLVSLTLENSLRKGRETLHCTVNVNEQECEKQRGEEEREGCLGDTKGTPENTKFSGSFRTS